MQLYGKTFLLARGLVAVKGKVVGATSDVFRSDIEERKVYEGQVVDAYDKELIGKFVLLPHKATNTFVDGEEVIFIYQESEILAWSDHQLSEPS